MSSPRAQGARRKPPSAETAARVVRVSVARLVHEKASPARLPRLYSAASAAERFSVSPALFFKLHREGRLVGYRLATCEDQRRQPLRFAEDDLLALIVPGGGVGAR